MIIDSCIKGMRSQAFREQGVLQLLSHFNAREAFVSTVQWGWPSPLPAMRELLLWCEGTEGDDTAERLPSLQGPKDAFAYCSFNKHPLSALSMSSTSTDCKISDCT